MLVGEPALMVVINGPRSLAAQLTEVEATTDSLKEVSVVLGAEVALSVSRTFVEAGADVVVLRERWTSAMSPEGIRRWVDSIEPIANLLRFYEVLPVLLLDAPGASGENLAQLANELPNCVLVPLPTDGRAKLPGLSRRLNGIALPVSIFESDQFKRGSISQAVTSLRFEPDLALLTSSHDVPPTADPKQVALFFQQVRSHISVSAQ